MGWWEKDQEAKKKGEVKPMPRELTNEETRAQEKRKNLSPPEK